MPFPVLVGNNRVYDRCGCELVITPKEIALLHHPHSVQEGTPPWRWWSSHLLTPSLLAGVREVEQCLDDQKHFNMYCGLLCIIPAQWVSFQILIAPFYEHYNGQWLFSVKINPSSVCTHQRFNTFQLEKNHILTDFINVHRYYIWQVQCV